MDQTKTNGKKELLLEVFYTDVNNKPKHECINIYGAKNGKI